MNLVRHELDLSRTDSRFPDQGDVPFDLFARRERRGAARAGARQGVSLVRELGGGTEAAVRRLCGGKAAPERARLRRPAALLGAHAGRAGFRGRDRRALRSCAGRRVSGHEPAAGDDPARAEARRTRPDRGRRRRAVDLFVPRRDGAQHPGFPRPFRPAGAHRHARAELSLDPADPRGLQRRDRACGRALHEESLVGARSFGAPVAHRGARRGRPGALRGGARAGEPRGGPAAASRRPCCSALRITPTRSNSS